MAGNEGNQKPKQPPRPAQPAAAKGPTTAVPARKATSTGGSSFDLSPVGGSFDDITRTGASARDLPRVSSSAVPRASSTSVPRTESSTAVTAQGLGPVQGPPARKGPSALQRQILSSGFDDDERTQVDTRLGAATSGAIQFDEDEHSALTDQSLIIDGETPVPEVTAVEDWKAVNAPVQSRPGKRSAKTTWLVIDQFACGANPRYRPEPGKPPRAHIFVWDVSRAMGCEVPHFLGGRVMPLGHTVDWLRTEGSARGWRRTVDLISLERATQQGLLVIALPRDARNKMMAVVRPGAFDAGQIRVACANLRPGNDMSLKEAFGVPASEYFIHD